MQVRGHLYECELLFQCIDENNWLISQISNELRSLLQPNEDGKSKKTVFLKGIK